jgi:hypothetical protein
MWNLWWVHRPGGAWGVWTSLLWLSVHGLLAQAPKMLHMQPPLLREAFKFKRESISVRRVHLSGVYSVCYLSQKSGRRLLDEMLLCRGNEIVGIFDTWLTPPPPPPHPALFFFFIIHLFSLYKLESERRTGVEERGRGRSKRVRSRVAM